MLRKLRDIQWNRVLYFTLFFIGVIVVVVIMTIVGKRDEQQLCKEVKIVIEGTEAFIDQSDISKLIAQNYGSFVGKKINGIPFQRVEKMLKKLPYVSDASIHADMDGTIKVNIDQREAVMRVINKNGREFYVDPKGLKIPTTLKYIPHIMVATGNISEGYNEALDTVSTTLVKDLVKVVEFIGKDELWSNQVVQIYVNADHDIELVPRVGTQQLIVGSADSLEQKFELLKTFYTQIMPKVGINAYGVVNVKYGGQIICEKRGNWSFADDQTKKIANNTL
ncbi:MULTISPECIES: cell division protein FtsQ/DivIB [unclassified Sphingobacterium]|uniref:cell division protein FtsQ/DivIB n=1 Tax=unclassified Sphingobacterium TaxID=2609468 RepID=UPI0025E2C52C|nr:MULTISPECIES: cell division protein FtsQ [unclassified Sphingobacterium]